MPEVAVIAPGKPAWVDLASPDLEASKRFYSSLFGWEPQGFDNPNSGGYGMLTLRGKEVAGLGPVQQPGQPPAWTVYIATKDAEATARKVESAGGKVAFPPMDVMEAGRMAVFQDPTGAFISVWQPNQMPGFAIVGESGSFAWAELAARGVDQAIPFYKAVFGWDVKRSSMGEGQPPYIEWQLDGQSIAGGMEMMSNVPAQVPSSWTAYFGVPDVDAAAAKAAQLGSGPIVPPQDFPGGRFAILRDPQGAVFGVLKMD
jgi:predicted enzyme related to lactoylglutathione lyase